MEKIVKFWDKWADRYYRKPITDMTAYEEKLTKTQSYLKPDMHLLEIGCGTGETALKHSSHVKHITATDISPNMVEIAKSRPEYNSVENVDFICKSIEEIDFAEEQYDAVLALSVLHLLPNPQKTIQNIYTSLKPGGVFVSSTACISDIAPILKWIAPVGYYLGLLPRLNFFTEKQLLEFFETAKFEIDYKRHKNSERKNTDQATFIIAIKK